MRKSFEVKSDKEAANQTNIEIHCTDTRKGMYWDQDIVEELLKELQVVLVSYDLDVDEFHLYGEVNTGA